ncbi:hypothetical protein GCM10007415_47670 [Parapedobacter pyrenivorans]|uniref:HTH araC/xylS-type domain-containing protein n=2 Tax=Parapedobacter pyrenivorans TaxID=1305674 RepID=A0A917MHQ8_9SPHI|nr:hypothetical protein GCM10007415_47670 [Parapedobacter pyrenivorans]
MHFAVMVAYILVATITVSLLSIYIRMVAGLKTRLDRYACYFLGYLTIHAAHALVVRTYFADQMRLDYFAPYGLLYGPFLYFAYRLAAGMPLRRTMVFTHAVPFLLFAACYFLWLAMPALFKGYELRLGLSLYGTLSVSFLSYTSWALYFRPINTDMLRRDVSRMMAMMAMVLAFVTVLFLAVAYASVVAWSVYSPVNGSVVFLCMLAASIILFSQIVGRTVRGPDAKAIAVDTMPEIRRLVPSGLAQPTSGPYEKSAIPANLLDGYETALRLLMEGKQAYLDDGLSLVSLAQQLKIPKHHLSQVFSLRIGKNFNTYVNALRIDHAVSLMHAHPEMTIGEIFFRSGFTAKASFNRYFKQFKGITPSEYRGRITS